MTLAELVKWGRQADRIVELARASETVFELTMYRGAARKVAQVVKAADLPAELEGARAEFVAKMAVVDAQMERAGLASLLAAEGGTTLPPGGLLQ